MNAQMDFFQKITQKPEPDLTWNIPDTKKGALNIIGGNSQNFRTEVKISEFVTINYPLQTINTVLPDALKPKLPDSAPGLIFLKSTDSGSFASGEELQTALDQADFNLITGDLSKNAITGHALASASASSAKPLLITRDAADLLADHTPEQALLNPNLILFASMPQLQKLFRAVYYPKVLLLSQSLIQVADALHKFTLSYPAKIITLHSDQILIAENGEVKAVPLEKTGYVPITLWQGELAAKIAVLNLYNPNNFLSATLSALFLR